MYQATPSTRCTIRTNSSTRKLARNSAGLPPTSTAGRQKTRWTRTDAATCRGTLTRSSASSLSRPNYFLNGSSVARAKATSSLAGVGVGQERLLGIQPDRSPSSPTPQRSPTCSSCTPGRPGRDRPPAASRAARPHHPKPERGLPDMAQRLPEETLHAFVRRHWCVWAPDGAEDMDRITRVLDTLARQYPDLETRREIDCPDVPGVPRLRDRIDE